MDRVDESKLQSGLDQKRTAFGPEGARNVPSHHGTRSHGAAYSNLEGSSCSCGFGGLSGQLPYHDIHHDGLQDLALLA